MERIHKSVYRLSLFLFTVLAVLALCGVSGALADGGEEPQAVDPVYGTPYLEIEDDGLGFIYNDSMLLGSSSTFSTDLVKASVVLADAGYSRRAAGMLSDMGYTNVRMLNDGDRSLEYNDKVAFTIGYKDVPGTNSRIWAIVIRGTGYNAEWFSDFNLGKNNGGEHQGFKIAADEVELTMKPPIDACGRRNIIWLTGHSRGAAVANILAARFTGYYGAANVFCYTFACPSVSKHADEGMSNIYNINNKGDLIPLLPLEDEWGYHRNGITRSYSFGSYDDFRWRRPGYQGVSGSSQYLKILNRLVPDEESYYEPLRFFAVNLIAYNLGGKASTTWYEFVDYYLPGAVGGVIRNIIMDATGLSALCDALNAAVGTIPEICGLIDDTLELVQAEEMTDEEFAQYLEDNQERFQKIAEATGTVIESAADLAGAKEIADGIHTAGVAWTAAEIIGCARELLGESDNNIGNAIAHAHEGASYVLWVNAKYLGYKGKHTYPHVESVAEDFDGAAITTIGSYCFTGCSSLTAAEMPHVRYIGTGAFDSCIGLLTANCGDQLTGIGASAFQNCSALSSPDLGGVQIIGAQAFLNCSNMTSLYLPDTLRSMAYVEDTASNHNHSQIVTIRKYPFFGCTGLASVSVGGIERLEVGMIPMHRDMTIVIRGSVKEIADHMFDTGGINAFMDYASDAALHITLAEGLEAVGAYAFSNSNITYVNLPGTVTRAGSYAFSCNHLDAETVALQQFTELGTGAFAGCTGIQSVTDGEEGAVDIPEYCFSGCTGLTSLELNFVRSIGGCAFEGCTGLTSLYLPDTLESMAYIVGESPNGNGFWVTIPKYPFFGCTGLASVSIGGIEKLEVGMIPIHQDMTIVIRGSVKEIGDKMFDLHISGIDRPSGLINTNYYQGHNPDAKLQITLAEGLETIGNEAFADVYPSLGTVLSVNLPDSVTRIGESAFLNCAGLNRETIALEQFTELGAGAFAGCTGIHSVTAGEGVTAVPDGCFGGCTGITSVDLGFVESIGANAFSGCTGLESLDLGTVQSIGVCAFEGCTGLASLCLPDTLESMDYIVATSPNSNGFSVTIHKYPFFGCTGLTSVSIGGIERLEVGMIPIHQDMAIVIRGSVKEIADSMFDMRTYGFNEFTKPSGLFNVNYYQGHNLEAKLQITLAEGLEAVGASAFADEDPYPGTVASVNLPDSVTRIGENAFLNCAGLNRETIALEQFTELGAGAFAGCTGIQTVIAGEGVTAVPDGCFGGCTGITSVDLGSVESIGSRAFAECTGLTEIHMPDTIRLIGEYAFDGTACTLLVYPYSCALDYAVQNSMAYALLEYRTMALPEGLAFIDDEAFAGIGAELAVIPAGTSSIGIGAFRGSTVRVLVFLGDECAIAQEALDQCPVVRIVCNPDSAIGQWALDEGYPVSARE